MIKGRRKILILFICVLVIPVFAGTPSTFLTKKVSLSAGELQLKTILKSLSDQTGCVFSYNPNIVNDKQSLSVPTLNGVPLSKALNILFQQAITYSISGKYILLQKKIVSAGTQVVNSKVKSIIDKDQKKVSLVIPDMLTIDLALAGEVIKDTLVKIIPSEKVFLKPDFVSITNTSIGEIKIDSADARKIRTRNFVRRTFKLFVGINSSSPLSSVIIQAGAYGLYGILSLSTDYNNSYRAGYGLGATLDFKNNMGLNLNIEQNSLFAGKSYDLGVNATLTHFDPLVTFAVSRDFRLFIGPSFYMNQSGYENLTSNLGVSYGVGAMIGVKLDLISLVTSHK